MHIDFTAQTGKEYLPYLRRWLPRAAAMVRTSLNELSIAVVSDRRMADLHQQFMDVTGPTDVLTFELDHDSCGKPVAGEVVICMGEARRQAGRSRQAVAKELLLYALHGVLHLSGFDDRTPSQYRKMHQVEDKILSKLGIGPVFGKRVGSKQ